MIISHQHKYIFIRPFKTAGSSIERFLLETAFNPKRDATGFKILKSPHLTANHIVENVNENVWREYVKVVCERNPWDKVVSWYFWDMFNTKVGNRNIKSIKHNLYYDSAIYKNQEWSITKFGEWFNNVVLPLNIDDLPRHNPLSHKYYFVGDKPIGDFFIKHESIDEDLASFFKMIGVNYQPRSINRYNEKAGVRPNWSKNYKMFYNDEMKNNVEELCSKTIKLLEYKF